MSGWVWARATVLRGLVLSFTVTPRGGKGVSSGLSKQGLRTAEQAHTYCPF